MAASHYIIVMRHADLWLVGPFNTNDQAADYGAAADDRIWDDPRWQTIELASTTYGLRIDPPLDLGDVTGAYHK